MRKALAMALMTALLPGAAWAAVELASHRAVYEVDIQKSTSASPVKSVAGRTAYTMQRHCDGWQSVEDYAVTFGLEEGHSDYISHYEIWESESGDAFSFSMHENSTLNGELRFNGFAHRNDGIAEAFFVFGEDSDSAITLPEDTVFPVAHTHRLIEKARNGEKFFQSTLFLGGDEGESLYRVSSVIGNRKQGSEPVLGTLGTDAYWPMRLAYFNPESLESVPEFELELNLQDNGVIRHYLVDYGDFSMAGSLESIEPLTEPDC